MMPHLSHFLVLCLAIVSSTINKQRLDVASMVNLFLFSSIQGHIFLSSVLSFDQNDNQDLNFLRNNNNSFPDRRCFDIEKFAGSLRLAFSPQR